MELWNILAEITVQPEDFPSGDTAGYMNIITWADSVDTAQAKIAIYFLEFGWQIVEIETVKPLGPDFLADNDEFENMIERARSDPNAIICGTFHSYKVN